MHGAKAGKCPKTAVGAGNHPLAADDAAVTFNPFRHQMGMFDKISRGIQRARDQDFVVGDLRISPDSPLMLMTRVGAFKLNRLRLGGQRNVNNLMQIDIVMMGPLVIPPAQVHPHAVGRHIFQRGIQGLYLRPRRLFESGCIIIAKTDMPTHRQIGTINLKQQTGFGDPFILDLHHRGQGAQIILVILIVFIGLEDSDHTRRGRIHKGFGGAGGFLGGQ